MASYGLELACGVPESVLTAQVLLQVEASLTSYAQSYHALKTPRKLQWKRHLGAVELDLAVGSRTLQLSVTPAQASLVLHFTGQATLSLVKLAQLMGMPAPAARNIALFWVAKGARASAHVGGYQQEATTSILNRISCGTAQGTGRTSLSQLSLGIGIGNCCGPQHGIRWERIMLSTVMTGYVASSGVLVESVKANGALHYARAKELKTTAPPSAAPAQQDEVSAVMSTEQQTAQVCRATARRGGVKMPDGCIYTVAWQLVLIEQSISRLQLIVRRCGAQSMAVYQQYVMGMLTNFDGLPFDRIHNMLKMFATDPPYDKTAAELLAFLGQLVAAGKLMLEPGGVYRKRVA